MLEEGAAPYRQGSLIKTDLDIETLFTNNLVAELCGGPPAADYPLTSPAGSPSAES